MSRRYLRAYLFGSQGQLLPPLMKSRRVSTALLPIMKLPGMKIYAGNLTEPSHERRRQAAVDTLTAALIGRLKTVYGVALVCCPDRRYSAYASRMRGRPVTLTATNGYLASFAAVGSRNQIWAGDAICESLDEIEKHLVACVEHIRSAKPSDKLGQMFAPVAVG